MVEECMFFVARYSPRMVLHPPHLSTILTSQQGQYNVHTKSIIRQVGICIQSIKEKSKLPLTRGYTKVLNKSFLGYYLCLITYGKEPSFTVFKRHQRPICLPETINICKTWPLRGVYVYDCNLNQLN